MAAVPKVLLAPITVTPSKPLTPSHLKGLFWADVLHRATGHLAEVTYRYSHTTYHRTEQVLGFWEFLDRTEGDTDYHDATETEIGELYVRYRAQEDRPGAAALRPYAEAVEESGWVHPASERVLRLWSGHYERLGLYDPGLREHQPPGLGLEEMIDRLVAAGCGLDQRRWGGSVHLDLTRWGLPLRQIVTPDGRPNYLACALRELLVLAPRHDEVVFLYDRELAPDYRLLERLLGSADTVVRCVPIGRVPIGGRIVSARHGGWQDHTVDRLLAAVDDEHDVPAIRLGLRLYFIAMLGPGDQQSFRHDLLAKSCARAERLLDRAARDPKADSAELRADLSRYQHSHRYVDPYRLTSSLLARSRRTIDAGLLSEVFL
ncbi:hypothetical protein [Streptantibioticus silvisoli]|uniref:Uncharacterized protein n=1 Tax=Streptantibioticus silvisoli TaxID=2705255 RepID=A0ABT6VT39_9ACTN|nr:hypothetical protein [Streptantibioticus silvisoli]MDI5961345.1 hypothetical protein [Streptantibioticus silvisoli]